MKITYSRRNENSTELHASIVTFFLDIVAIMLTSLDKDFLYQSLISRKYCVEACEVPEPEDFFHIDQYSDIVTIAKPSIYISVQEIIDTHQVRITCKRLT